MNKEFFFSLDSDGIVKYFQDEREETSQLEFKNGDTPLNKLYKEIVAFANTDGGILILGTPSETEKKINGIRNTFCQGEIIPSKINKSEDDLLSSILSNITPSPLNIEVERISIEHGSVYIIYVPKSKIKPHQHNYRYYIRVNTMSLPAEHGIVEMMFNQTLEIDLTIEVLHQLDRLNNNHVITIALKNLTKIPAQQAEMFVSLVGKLRQIVNKDDLAKLGQDYKLRQTHNKNGYSELSKSIKFDSAVIDKIWQWYHIYDLRLPTLGYCYIQVTYWAQGVPAKTNYYKLFTDVSKPIERIDLESETPERQEYNDWRSDS